jgi:hypothetical protein
VENHIISPDNAQRACSLGQSRDSTFKRDLT